MITRQTRNSLTWVRVRWGAAIFAHYMYTTAQTSGRKRAHWNASKTCRSADLTFATGQASGPQTGRHRVCTPKTHDETDASTATTRPIIKSLPAFAYAFRRPTPNYADASVECSSVEGWRRLEFCRYSRVENYCQLLCKYESVYCSFHFLFDLSLFLSITLGRSNSWKSHSLPLFKSTLFCCPTSI